MTTPKLDPEILFQAEAKASPSKPKPQTAGKPSPSPAETSSETLLHHATLEVLLILAVQGQDISQKSLAFALSTRNNIRGRIKRELNAPLNPTRKKV